MGRIGECVNFCTFILYLDKKTALFKKVAQVEMPFNICIHPPNMCPLSRERGLDTLHSAPIEGFQTPQRGMETRHNYIDIHDSRKPKFSRLAVYVWLSQAMVHRPCSSSIRKVQTFR